MKITKLNISKRRKITFHIVLYQNNNEIYYENSNCDWYKREYDQNNNEVYQEYSLNGSTLCIRIK